MMDADLSDAMKFIRAMREADPITWENLWKIPCGTRFEEGIWLSGKGWNNLPGRLCRSEDEYRYFKSIAEYRKANFPINAERERVLRMAGEKEIINDPTGWRGERLDDLPEDERKRRILGKS